MGREKEKGRWGGEGRDVSNTRKRDPFPFTLRRCTFRSEGGNTLAASRSVSSFSLLLRHGTRLSLRFLESTITSTAIKDVARLVLSLRSARPVTIGEGQALLLTPLWDGQDEAMARRLCSRRIESFARWVLRRGAGELPSAIVEGSWLISQVGGLSLS